MWRISCPHLSQMTGCSTRKGTSSRKRIMYKSRCNRNQRVISSKRGLVPFRWLQIRWEISRSIFVVWNIYGVFHRPPPPQNRVYVTYTRLIGLPNTGVWIVCFEITGINTVSPVESHNNDCEIESLSFSCIISYIVNFPFFLEWLC